MDKEWTFKRLKICFHFLGNRNRYRTPITSASVFDTLLEGPKMSFAVLGSGDSNRNSSTSESSSTESLRNGLYFKRSTQPDKNPSQ